MSYVLLTAKWNIDDGKAVSFFNFRFDLFSEMNTFGSHSAIFFLILIFAFVISCLFSCTENLF